jgi:hypothetical protein
VAVMPVRAGWSGELASFVVDVDAAGAVEEAAGAASFGLDVSICAGVDVEEINGGAF